MNQNTNNFIKKIEKIKSAYLLFSPFFLLFIFIVLRFRSSVLVGDESRYFYFANNLLHGFYSPSSPNINLWNGPGYPMFLMPFVALKVPSIVIVLVNAFFYYLSIVLLFKMLRQITSFRLALAAAIFWGCYYNSYQDMLLMCTETVTSFLITLFLFLLLKVFNANGKTERKYILLSGLVLGYIILTKILFAYVLIVLLVGSFALYFFYKRSSNYKKSSLIMLVALIAILPYLIYTYSLTGRVFYLGNSGGMSLYWMSTPNQNEYGDWFDENGKTEKNGNLLENYENELRLNHKEDYEEIYKYTSIERDDAYKRLAFRNIKNNPVKFLENTASNIGRLLFSHPYSYTLQSNKNLLRLPLTGLLLVLMLFSLIPTIKNWKKIIFPLRLILIFLLVYLGLSTMLSAYTRMFSIIVPLLLFWVVYIITKSVKINFRFNEQKETSQDLQKQ